MNPSTSPPSSPLSSPLSSVASRSPSPPADYPSPPSSNVSDTGLSSLAGDATGDFPDRDGPPPAKKQKIAKPRELKTEYLDLRTLNDSPDETLHEIQDPKLKKLMEVLRKKKKVVVIAGAGISVSAGIPDFRSSTGLFNTLRGQHKLKGSGKQLFDASVYRNDSSTSSFHDMVRELSHLTQKAKPTPFHHMLATLAEEGRLMRLYSQNVDGIDTSLEPLATKVPLNLKGPWPKTIQLHGGLEKMVCSKCGHLSDFDGALFEGPEPPLCKECENTDGIRIAVGLRSHGIGRLRPRMVLYNEFNPDEEAIGAVSHADLKSRPDAVIVVGTSLKVPGIRRLAKEMCAVTRGRRGGFTAWINHDPEPLGVDFKDSWDMVVRGECDEVARLVGLPHYDDKDCGDYRIPEGQEEKSKEAIPEVVLKSKALTFIKSQGILTPGASPRQQSPVPTNGPPKTKQPQLPFGSSKPAPEKDSKVKKKPGRKPLPSKPMKPTAMITDAFTTSKVSKSAVGKPTKQPEPDLDSSPIQQHAFFPGLTKPEPSTPIRALSPADYRTNTGSGSYKQEGSGSGYSNNFEIQVPYNRRETISPKGRIPTDMRRLLS